MTEKRFIVIDVPYENGEPFLYKKMLDKTTKKEYDNTLKGIDDMCDLSNKLHEENEQLKYEIVHLKSEIVQLKNELAYKDQHSNKKVESLEEWARGGF